MPANVSPVLDDTGPDPDLPPVRPDPVVPPVEPGPDIPDPTRPPEPTPGPVVPDPLLPDPHLCRAATLTPRPQFRATLRPVSTTESVPPTSPRLLQAAQLLAPSEVAAFAAEQARQECGADWAVVYLVNYGLSSLVPLPGPATTDRRVLALEGSFAGRAFIVGESVVSDGLAEGIRVWCPLEEGALRDRRGGVRLRLLRRRGVADRLRPVRHRAGGPDRAQGAVRRRLRVRPSFGADVGGSGDAVVAAATHELHVRADHHRRDARAGSQRGRRLLRLRPRRLGRAPRRLRRHGARAAVGDAGGGRGRRLPQRAPLDALARGDHGAARGDLDRVHPRGPVRHRAAPRARRRHRVADLDLGWAPRRPDPPRPAPRRRPRRGTFAAARARPARPSGDRAPHAGAWRLRAGLQRRGRRVPALTGRLLHGRAPGRLRDPGDRRRPPYAGDAAPARLRRSCSTRTASCRTTPPC